MIHLAWIRTRTTIHNNHHQQFSICITKLLPIKKTKSRILLSSIHTSHTVHGMWICWCLYWPSTPTYRRMAYTSLRINRIVAYARVYWFFMKSIWQRKIRLQFHSVFLISLMWNRKENQTLFIRKCKKFQEFFFLFIVGK